MTFAHWFRQWSGLKAKGPFQSRRARKVSPRTGFKPRLEILEDRIVPTMFPVSDTGTSPLDPNSLPGAVALADMDTTGTAVINFIGQTFATPQTISLPATLNISGAITGESICIAGPTAGLTIQGGGPGGPSFSAVTVAANTTATIDNLTISDFFTVNSGAGIDNAGALTVKNSTIGENHANVGGGIFNSGTLTLMGATLVDNFAGFNGGGIAGGTLTVANSTFSGNSAGKSGGGIAGGTGTIDGSTFSNNAAVHNDGGGIYNGDYTITDSTFADNSADNGHGGAIYNSLGPGPTIGSSTLAGNNAGGGGGIYNVGTLTLSNSTLADNVAYTSAGGGIYNAGTLNVDNATFFGNSANPGNSDGAIYNTGTLTIYDDTLAGNAGGINNAGAGTLTLANTIVSDNTAEGNADIAGSITTDGGYNLLGTDVAAATDPNPGPGDVPSDAPLLAPLGNYGGPTQTMALMPDSPPFGVGAIVDGITTDQRGMSRPTLPDIGAFQTQSSNTVTTSSDTPGAGDMSLQNAVNLAEVDTTANTIVIAANVSMITLAAPITVTAGTITINSAAPTIISGNGVTNLFQIDSGANVTLGAGITLENADPNYGAVDNAGTLTLIAVALEDNVATESGGAIYNTGMLTVTDCTFSNNSASDNGGAIDNDGGTVNVSNSSFSGNNAGIDGGAIDNENGGILVLAGCTVSDNTATDGGGIYNDGMLTIGNCILAVNSTNYTETLSGNETVNFTGGGGGIFNSGIMTVTGSTLSGNSVNDTRVFDGDTYAVNMTSGGGGIYNSGSLTVTNSSLAGNSYYDARAFDGDGYVVNTTGGGGGIYNSGSLTVTGSTLSSNTLNDNRSFDGDSYTVNTTGGGGGVYDSGSLTVTNSSLSGNYIYDNGAFDGTGYTVNTAGGGGGIFDSGSLTVTNSTVAGNSFDDTRTFDGNDSTVETTAGGGGVFNVIALTAFDTIVADNTASTAPDIDGSLIGNDNLIGDSAGPGSINGAGNITDDPALLSILGNYGGPTQTVALLPGSPAIGTGGSVTTITADNGSTITVADGAAIASTDPANGSGYVIQIDNEEMLVTAVDGDTLTVTRGYHDTTQVTHDSGAGVFLALDQRGINRPANSYDIGAFQSQGFTLSVNGGASPQTTYIGTPFANPLGVTVASAYGEPVDGGMITYSVPGSGASASLSNLNATINDGQASVTATANGAEGTYVVAVIAAGVAAAGNFELTNNLNPTLGMLSPPEILAGQAYRGAIAIGGGTAPFSITDTSGLGGLSAAISGDTVIISGAAPATPQTINFSVAIQDGAGGIASQSYSLVVDAPGVYTVTNTSNDASVVGSFPWAVAEADNDTSGATVTINFAAGAGQTFATPRAIFLAGTLNLDNTAGESIVIDGPAAALTIDGGGSSSDFTDFTVPANTASIENLIISNGNTRGSGGGIYNDGTLTLSHCTISGNLAANYGGGIYNDGTLTVCSSIVSSNSSSLYAGGGYGGGGIFNSGTLIVGNATLSDNATDESGGGIYNIGGTVTLSNATLTGNSGGDGGGINNSGTLTVTGSTFTSNSASDFALSIDGDGGGISNYGTLTVANSTLSANSADSGGGIDNSNMATVTNSTLSDNVASANGGGIFSGNFSSRFGAAASLTVIDSTLAGNSAADLGGGICNGGIPGIGKIIILGGGSSATLTVSNCTLAGNTAIEGGGIFNGYIFNVLNRDAGAALTVSDSTLAGNSASADGGGIDNLGTLSAANTIVAGNNATSGVDIDGNITGNNNLIGDSSGLAGISNGINGNITDQPPLLSVLGNYGGPTQTIAVMPLSPAIGAGGAVTSITADNGSTITVADGAAIASTDPADGSGYVIQIDNEQMLVTAVDGDTLTVTRGYNSTTQISHDSGAGVFFASDQRGISRPTSSPDIGAYQSQGLTGVEFTNLTASQTISYGTPSVTLSGRLAANAGQQQVPSGEPVTITLDGVPQTALFDSNDDFSTTFDTHALGVSGSPYSITYSYAGDLNFLNASDGSTALTVGAEGTTTKLSAPAVFYGQDGLVTVTVAANDVLAGTPTGSVTLSVDGGSPVPGTLSNGSYTFDVGTLPVGPHTLSASFAAQGNYGASSVSGSLTVSPIVVTSKLDDGSTGSLRWAITQANADTGPLSIIDFDIAASGVQTIQVGSSVAYAGQPLPALTKPVVIDGTSEPGYAGSPLIVLDGALAGMGSNGLTIAGGNSTVKGLNVNNFSGAGIDLASSGNTVQKMGGLSLHDQTGGNTITATGVNAATDIQNSGAAGDSITVSTELGQTVSVAGDGLDALTVINIPGINGQNYTITANAITSGDGLTAINYQGLGSLIFQESQLTRLAEPNNIAVNALGAPLTFQDVGTGAGDVLTVTSALAQPLVIQGNGTDSLYVDAPTNVTLSGAISGVGELRQEGTGTTILTGANTYSGLTEIDAGTLQIGNGGSTGALGTGAVIDNAQLAFDRSNSLIVPNLISGMGAVTQLGTGTATLTAANTYTGVTSIIFGTLQVGAMNAIPSMSDVFVQNGATLDLDGHGDTIGALWGAGIVTDSVAGMATLTVGATNDSANFTGIIQDGSGTVALTKTGAGAETLTGANTYSGLTTISTGTLQVGNGGASGTLGTGPVTDNAALSFDLVNGAVVANAISGAGSLAFQTASGDSPLILTGANTYSGPTTIDPDEILQIGNDGTTGSLGTGPVTDNGELDFDRSNNLTVANPIAGNGSIDQIGTGTITLTGANIYSGITEIDSGVLQVGAATALPSTGLVFDDGTLDLDGHNATISALDGNRQYGIVTSSVAGPVTLTVGAMNDSGDFSGVIQNGSGLVALTKIGAGRQNLSGANTYSGTTTISAGTLEVGDGGTSGTLGTGAVTDNATLIFDVANSSTTVANAIGGTGSLIQAGMNILILTGANNYSGTTTILTGTFLQVGDQVGDGGTTGTLGTGAVIDNYDLLFDRTNALTVANRISGSGGLAEMGGGTLILTGANTYTGATAIDSGTLQVGAPNTVSSTSDVYDNATLDLDGHSDIIGALNGTGIVTSSVPGAATLTVGADNDSGSFSGVIQNGSGTVALTKTGTGTETLTGANSYRGPTTIAAGTLQVGNGGTTGALGTGSIVVNAALVFDLTSIATVANAVTGTGSLNQVGVGTTILTGTDTYSGGTTISAGILQVGNGGTSGALGAGPITDNASLTIDLSTNTTLVGAIGGTGAFFQIGAGVTTLTGADSYSGPTTISAGTLQVGNGGTTGALGTGSVTDNAALQFDLSNSITVANSIGGAGTLTQAGTAITILTGANSYSGTTIISAGTLQIGNGGTTGTLGAGPVTDNAALSFGLSANANALSDTTVANAINGTGSLTEDGLENDLLILTGANSYSGTTTISNYVTLWVGNGGTTGTLGTGPVTDNGGLEFYRSNNLTVPNRISGSGYLAQLGAGTLVLTGANTYSGSTSISPATTLKVGAVNAIPNTSDVDGYGTLDLDGHSDIIGALGGNGGIVTSSVTGAVTLTVGASNDSLGFDGDIQNGSGTVALAKTGSGTEFLFGANSYSGPTTISAGTLEVGAANALPSTSDVTDNATLDLYYDNGDTIGALSGSGTVSNITDVPATLTVGATNDSGTFSGVMQNGNGTLALTKIGTGTETLTGANSYTGPTTITAGVLQVGNGGSTGNLGSGAVSDNTTLSFDLSNSTTVPNAISGVGTLSQVGTGTTILTGANTYNGITTISAGTLQVGNGGGTGTLGTNAVTDNSVLSFDLSSSTIVANAVSGTGALVQFGAATTILTGANSYSGTTTISAGGLGVGDDGTTGTLGAGAVTDNGALYFRHTNNLTVGNRISGTGILAQADSGATILTGANSYSGTTNINAGTLQVGAVNAIPSTSDVLDFATLDLDGHSDIVGALGGNGIVTSSVAGPVTLMLGADNGGGSFGGVIQNGSGTVALTKTGTGTESLAGNNTYSGATTISGGVLQIGIGGATGSLGSGAVIDNAALVFDLNTNITVANAITGTGSLTQEGYVIVLTGANTYSGTTTINVNAFLWIGYDGMTGTLGTGPVVIANNAFLVFYRSNSVTVANRISGSGALNQIGAGALILTAANTYSGITTIDSGTTIEIGAANALPSASNVFDFGTLDLDGHNDAIGALGSIPNTPGIVTSSVAGTATLTIAATTASLPFYGVIQNGAGTVALTTSGTGTETLLGANSYSGPTTINAGTLQAGAVNAIPGTSDVTDNATLDLDGNNDTIGALNGAGTVTSSVTGPVTLTVGATNHGGAFNGVVQIGSGTLALTKTGTGVETLTGANTYTGATTIGTGTLQVGNGGATGALGAGAVTDNAVLIFDLSAPAAVANAIIGTGVLTQAGTGTTTLTGANTYSGTTTIGAGTLQIGNGGMTGTLGTGPVTDNAALRFDLSIESIVANVISGTGSLTQAGSGGINLTGANSYTGLTTISAGVLGVGNGGTIGTLGTGAVTDNAALGFQRSNTLTVANRISGTGSLSQSGTGTLILTGANTYGGITDIAGGGTIQVGVANAVPSTSDVYDYSTLDLAGHNDTIGALFEAGTVTNSVSGTATLAFGATNNTGLFSGVIHNGSGIVALTKIGPNEQILIGANTYSGTTTVSTGVLGIGYDGTTGTLGTGPVIDNADLAFDLTSSTTVANPISGTGGISQLATGTTILTGANTYSGGTLISAGTFQAGNGGTNGTLGTGIITDDGALDFDRSNNLTVANPINGSGSLAQSGTGTLVLTGVNTYSGTTFIYAGTLKEGAANALPITYAVIDYGTLDLDGHSFTIGALGGPGVVTSSVPGAVTLTEGAMNVASNFSGVIQNGSGTVALTKIDTGYEMLSGANTYSGPTTISADTLEVDGAQPNSAVTVNGGATLAGSGTVGAITAKSGGTVKPDDLGVTGILTSGNATFASGATFAVELNGTTAGSGYDQLNVTGTLSLGNSTLNLSLGSSFAANPGTTFTIINTSKVISGTFSGLPEGSMFTVDGQEFTISYKNDKVTLTYVGPS